MNDSQSLSPIPIPIIDPARRAATSEPEQWQAIAELSERLDRLAQQLDALRRTVATLDEFVFGQ